MKALTLAFLLITSTAWAQVRINCGGPAYIDPAGNTWATDSNFSGVSVGTSATGHVIAGTTMSTIYQTGRYGNPLQYRFTGLTPGNYTITLKFAEFVHPLPNQRIMSWAINGNNIISNLDLAAVVPKFTAYDQGPFSAVVGADGNLTITGTATVDMAKVNAIEILPAPLPPIQLPIEVIGLDRTTSTASFSVPSGATGPFTLSMTIHGLKYDTQASFQINQSAWVPLSSSTVTVLGLGASYGGIGGGFKTIDLTVPAPLGAISAGGGANSITFRFNKTNGVNSGFRVLAFNVLDATGTTLIPSSAFVQDDPTQWQPPLPDAANIAAGQQLWSTALLNSPIAIKATCSSCHTQDGRDLKYFNYSNYAIRGRAMFHGLSATQGDQIASYIRSLTTPNPGRPWNPPYQPGPGMDATPVSAWAAGAGLGAVLKRDADMWPALSASIATWDTGNLNARETPIAMQLDDWNSWLPTTHPIDAWGAAFTGSQLYTNYLKIRGELKPGDPVSYNANKEDIWLWIAWDQNFLSPLVKPGSDSAWGNPAYTDSIYSLRLWSMVKQWEINQEFGLEGMAPVAFQSQDNPRAWYSDEPFIVSPNMIHLPSTATGLVMGNGLTITFTYKRFIWYQLQLILNSVGQNGIFGQAAICCDFPYTYYHIDMLGFSNVVPSAPKRAGIMMEWLIKGMQSQKNAPGPDKGGSQGWGMSIEDPSRMFRYPMWSDWATTDKLAAMTAYLQFWLTKVSSYTPQQFYTGGWATASDIPGLPGDPWYGFANTVYGTLRYSQCHGVNATLRGNIAAWAKTMWSSYSEWNSVPPITCTQ